MENEAKYASEKQWECRLDNEKEERKNKRILIKECVVHRLYRKTTVGGEENQSKVYNLYKCMPTTSQPPPGTSIHTPFSTQVGLNAFQCFRAKILQLHNEWNERETDLNAEKKKMLHPPFVRLGRALFFSSARCRLLKTETEALPCEKYRYINNNLVHDELEHIPSGSRDREHPSACSCPARNTENTTHRFASPFFFSGSNFLVKIS